MPASNLTRVEAKRRAETVSAVSYSVHLDLTRDDAFRSDTVVRFAAKPGSATFLELVSDEVHAVTLNGTAIDPASVSDGTRLHLDDLAAANELRVVATMRYTNSGEGLDRFVDPVDQQPYLYTQFAVADAGRVYPVFDQPDLKASVSLTVLAPSHWEVLSNAPTPEPVPITAEVAEWRFLPGPPISSYIIALMAGPYASWRSETVSADGRTIPLGVFTRASLARHAEPDVMFDVLRTGMAYFEEAFGIAYPYEKYDQIFVPDFNWGAMENVGAVTFNEAYIFRSKVPEVRIHRRTLVVLHELSHMWFGNLVTMRWWNDLWLNESFATWAATTAAVDTGLFPEGWTTFAVDDKSSGAMQDQLPTSHPIVAVINDLEDVEVNFDAITYDKGAGVLKQLVAWVGRDPFLKGVGAYLRAHAHGNATLHDLLAQLERASGRPLAKWSMQWLETAGINTLRVELETEVDASVPGGPETITRATVVQSPPAGSEMLRPHRIAIGAYALDDEGALRRTERIELDVVGARTEVPALVGLRRPALVLPNDDDLTFSSIRLDAHSLHTVVGHLRGLDDPLAHAVIWGSVWDAVRQGELPARDYIQLALGHLDAETESGTRREVLAALTTAVNSYTAPQSLAQTRSRVGDALWDFTHRAAAGSDAQLQFMLAFTDLAATEAHADDLAMLLDGSEPVPGIAVDTELRWAIVRALAALGRASEDTIGDALALDDTSRGRLEADTALAARADAAAKRAAFAAVLAQPAPSNERAGAIARGWGRVLDAALVADDVAPYLAQLDEVWETRSFAIAKIVVRDLFPSAVVTTETSTLVHAWLEAGEHAPALRRLVVERLDELDRALAARERDAR
ncbi:MAG: aminopeptidase N [Microbacteriaceae bacterium]|jgi:aminopeptidase N|nr:aminopeptidase N [Microbacteriaceae bacterium]HPZ34343.1 aminopeptidase N [Microbacteriaceae bacterium]HQC93077.1 aminopeptidase N [Microbacteriaceae bacterium]